MNSSQDTDKCGRPQMEFVKDKNVCKTSKGTKSKILFLQYENILDSVRAPKNMIRRNDTIITFFRQNLLKEIPLLKVITFRNWYLKMKNLSITKTDPLLVFVYSINDQVPNENVSWLSTESIERYTTANKKFRSLSQNETGCEFVHKSSGTSFFVVTSKHALPEVQLCQLAKYYFQFDTRLRPLFNMAQYWKVVNEVHFGQPEVPTKIHTNHPLPDPYPFHWLLITFLIHENYLPSVRTILERSDQKIIEEETGADIGFNEDTIFAGQWADEHQKTVNSKGELILDTLQIFQKFLQFCVNQIFEQEGEVIINPKDGEIMETAQVIQGNFKSKLTKEEVKAVLANLHENSQKSWYMIHPLITKWRFSVPEKKSENVTCSVVNKTNNKLKTFLNLIETKGAEKAFEICEESLCDILKVESDTDVVFSRKRHFDETVEKDDVSCGNKGIENDTQVENPITLLEELAQKNNWEPPNYLIGNFKIKRGGAPCVKNYLYTVEINGQKYKQSWSKGRSMDAEEAKKKAAQFCLENLQMAKGTKLSSTKRQKRDRNDI